MVMATTCSIYGGGEECPFHLLYRMMPQGVVLADENGEVLAANPAAERIIGMPAEQMCGSSTEDYGELFCREDGTQYPLSDAPTMISLRTGGEIRGVVMGVYNQREKCIRWVTVSSFPLRISEDGNPARVCTTFEDITEEINLKKQLEKAYEHEHEVALILQEALFPDKLKVNPEYRIADKYIPATERTSIGGDIYDVFLTKKGKCALLIGDAAGKGLVTASFAMTSRSVVRAFAFETSLVSETLTRANKVLYSRQIDRDEYGIFATLFLMILDFESGEFSYSCAGHLPPLVWHGGGNTDALKLGQLPLGICSDQQYESHHGILLPGDKIFLFTDGLSEAKSGDIQLDEEGVACYLREFGHLPPKDALDRIGDKVFAWAGGRSNDDMAMLILERIGDAS